MSRKVNSIVYRSLPIIIPRGPLLTDETGSDLRFAIKFLDRVCSRSSSRRVKDRVKVTNSYTWIFR